MRMVLDDGDNGDNGDNGNGGAILHYTTARHKKESDTRPNRARTVLVVSVPRAYFWLSLRMSTPSFPPKDVRLHVYVVLR